MALFSTENRLFFAKYIFCFTLFVTGFLLIFDIIFPFILGKPWLIGENLSYLYHNALLVVLIILPLLVYQKLRSPVDDDWRKSAEVLVPVCILGLLFLLVTGIPGLLKTGEGLPASSATAVATPAADAAVTVNVSELQARYGMYGSCADVSRASLEIGHNDEIYDCSNTAKSLQLDNTNCYFDGIYIDKQVLQDFASLSGEICRRDAAKTSSSASDNIQYCRDKYPGSSYDPAVNKCVFPAQGIPKEQKNH